MEWAALLPAMCLSAAWTCYQGCQFVDACRSWRRAKADHERAKERLRRYTLGGGSDGEVWLIKQALACGLSGRFSDRRH